jgi:hypothetical protein
MTINVVVVGVDTFKNNISQTSIYDIKNYLEDVWSDQMEDGSGDYEAHFTTQSTTIPDSSLCDSSRNCRDYWDRADEADGWLSTNWSWNRYTGYDVIVVADYVTNSNKYNYRGAAQSTAGTTTDKVAILDANEIQGDTTFRPNPIEKIAAHELFHMFLDEPKGEEHRPFLHWSSRSYSTLGTLMWDPGNPMGDCYDGQTPDDIEDDISNCTENIAKEWIDNNM